MFSITVFILLVAAVSADASHEDGESEWTPTKKVPDFCGIYTCPTYKVLKKFHSYELRSYPTLRWIQSSAKGHLFFRVSLNAFTPIYMYFHGKNAENRTMMLTTPFVGKLSNIDERAVGVAARFFAPDSYKTLPASLDPALKVGVKTPSMKVYVRSFFSTDITFHQIRREKNRLIRDLHKHGASYDEKNIFFAGYNNIYEAKSRYNEIWIEA